VEDSIKELWSESGAVLFWLDGFDGPLAYLKAIELTGELSIYFLFLALPLCVKKGVKVRLPIL
jgi:hypothetical protein